MQTHSAELGVRSIGGKERVSTIIQAREQAEPLQNTTKVLIGE